MPIRNRLRPLAYESLPEGYTRCEYLESTGRQFIDADIRNTYDIEIWCRFAIQEESLNQDWKLFGGGRVACTVYSGYFREYITPTTLDDYDFYGHNYNPPKTFNFGRLTNLSTGAVVESKNWFNGLFEGSKTILFKIGHNSDTVSGNSYLRIYRFEAKNRDTHRILLPCLDPTGKPCMFDLVSRTPFYNQSTTGPDFLYKTYSYPFNPPDNWHSANRKIKEIVGSTKYTLELTEDGK